MKLFPFQQFYSQKKKDSKKGDQNDRAGGSYDLCKITVTSHLSDGGTLKMKCTK